MKRPVVAAVLFLALLAPAVGAAPQVLPVASSAVAVDGAVDYFEFAPGGLTAVGTIWTVIGPDGNRIEFIRQSTDSCTDTDGTGVRFTLDGTRTNDANCNVGGSPFWISEGDLDGLPADGTWTIQVRPSPNYISAVPGAGVAQDHPAATLFVNGRGITFGMSFVILNSQIQYWNYHQTTGIWEEPSSTPNQVPGTSDTLTEGPEEDPNNAVFFSDVTGPDVSPFTAYTLHSTVSCAGTGTVTVNGAWLGADGTAFTRYAYLEGNFLGTPDLRAVAGSALTAEESEGATAAGTDADAGLAYNNAAGVSYQFITRTVAQGVVLGVVQWAPSLQCTPAAPGGSVLYATSVGLSLTVSQAQCENDLVGFSTDIDLTALLTLGDLQVTVFNAVTGTEITTYDEAEMFSQNSGQVRYFADVFPPGAYMAIAQADITGIGAIDFYRSATFNVPRGTCIDSPTDLSPVLLAIGTTRTDILNSLNYTQEQILAFWADYNTTALDDVTNVLNAIAAHDEHMHDHFELINASLGDIYDVVSAINLTVICTEETGTCNFFIDNETLQAIYENLTMHRHDSLEVMGMSFDGLGFDGSVLTLLWLIALIWCLRNGKVFAASICTIGCAVSFVPDMPDWVQVAALTLFTIALWVEAILRDKLYDSWAGTKKGT